ncbi:hypothetical protein Tco_0000127 [Tanacetum coccineum]
MAFNFASLAQKPLNEMIGDCPLNCIDRGASLCALKRYLAIMFGDVDFGSPFYALGGVTTSLLKRSTPGSSLLQCRSWNTVCFSSNQRTNILEMHSLSSVDQGYRGLKSSIVFSYSRSRYIGEDSTKGSPLKPSKTNDPMND